MTSPSQETSSLSSLSILGPRRMNNNERNVCQRNSSASISSSLSSSDNSSTSPPSSSSLLLPIDRSLVTHAMNVKTNMITIETLMKEDQNKIPRQTKIDLQLLRIIANNRNMTTNLGPARVYGAYKNTRNQSSNVNYSRLFYAGL